MPRTELLQRGLKLETGYIDLYGEYGKRYRNRALYVPGYGYVPCSRKLNSNFTNKSERLMLVISEPNDSFIPVTSGIWITCRKDS